MCAHARRLRMRYTVLAETPNRVATSAAGLSSDRIAITSASVSLDIPCCSPYFNGGTPPRPFSIMSKVLSRIVPQNRCAELQHGGLSQECRTRAPSGIGPFSSAHAIWCAFKLTPRPAVIRPYPNGCLASAIHGQHSLSAPFWTFGQNRFSRLARRLASPMIFVSGVMCRIMTYQGHTSRRAAWAQ